MTTEKDKLIISVVTEQGYTINAGKLVAAVARHETGNYTSYLARKCNNLFGMKYFAGARYHKKKCEKSEYVHYEKPEDSVRDYMLWLQRRKIDLNKVGIEELVIKMKSGGYYEDKVANYLRGVRLALKKIDASEKNH